MLSAARGGPKWGHWQFFGAGRKAPKQAPGSYFLKSRPYYFERGLIFLKSQPNSETGFYFFRALRALLCLYFSNFWYKMLKIWRHTPKKFAPFGRDFSQFWLVLIQNWLLKPVFCPPQAKHFNIPRLHNDFPFGFWRISEKIWKFSENIFGTDDFFRWNEKKCVFSFFPNHSL